MSTAAPVDFWFEFSSPYGYIASQIAEDVEKRMGRPMKWRPMLLGPIFKLTGSAPLVGIPLKGEYSKRDFARTARMLNVPFRFPDRFPIGTAAALRAFYWVDDRDPAKARELAKKMYRAYFAENRDIGPVPVVCEIANSIGIDAGELGQALEDPAMKERGKREVDKAIAAGVFGSPYFIVDGEPFWGVDRLPMLEKWVKTGGW